MRQDATGPVGLPDEIVSDAALKSILDDLGRSLDQIPQTQHRLMSLSAVAWSPDRMVKVEVGPRGQLVDIEIDPRVFRRPDARALRSAILAAAGEAIRKVTEQAFEVMVGAMPPDLTELRARFDPDGDDPIAEMLRTDADVIAERRRRDEQR